MKFLAIIQLLVIMKLNMKNSINLLSRMFTKKHQLKIKQIISLTVGHLLLLVSIYFFSTNMSNKKSLIFLVISIYFLINILRLFKQVKKERLTMTREYDINWPKLSLYLALIVILFTIMGSISLTLLMNLKQAIESIILFSLIIISLVYSIIIITKEKIKYQKNASEEFYNIAEQSYDNQNYDEAVVYYEKAAKMKHGKAQNALGVCYDKGLGVVNDYDKAFYWIKKSYDNNCSDSFSNIAYYYKEGKGTEIDNLKSFEAYMKASINNNPKVLYEIGVFYEEGKGIEKNLEKAYEYYNKAKDLGNIESIYKVGIFYEEGIVVQKNDKKAYELFQKAANNNHSLAQIKIGKYNEEEIKKELDKIIGMQSVKEEVLSLQAFAKFQRSRKERNITGTQNLTLHMIFKGNPGTGKTTIARTVASMFRNIGVLKTNKVVEVDREKLVGKYVGHTAAQTKELVESALDGVLFIDEAYTLSKGGANDFGREAIDTLVKLMEDYRDRLVIILAGYSNEMDEFLETNPGLSSRFPNIIEFPNYSTDELLKIAELFCQKSGYKLSDDALEHLKILLDTKREEPKFGNGRGVRNIFEKSVRNMARRLSKIEDYDTVSNEELQLLVKEDIEI